MKTKIVTKTIYIANNGKEFNSESDCIRYEKDILSEKVNIQYFQIKFYPERTEKGYYTANLYIAVHDRLNYHYQICLQYCVNNLHMKILEEGVMGYGYMPGFIISKITKEKFESEYDVSKLFLSTINIPDYPENINYKKLWNFK